MCIRDRLKAAYAEESFYVGADQLDALVAIKSKNEVIADIVAPVSYTHLDVYKRQVLLHPVAWQRGCRRPPAHCESLSIMRRATHHEE